MKRVMSHRSTGLIEGTERRCAWAGLDASYLRMWLPGVHAPCGLRLGQSEAAAGAPRGGVGIVASTLVAGDVALASTGHRGSDATTTSAVASSGTSSWGGAEVVVVVSPNLDVDTLVAVSVNLEDRDATACAEVVWREQNGAPPRVWTLHCSPLRSPLTNT